MRIRSRAWRWTAVAILAGTFCFAPHLAGTPTSAAVDVLPTAATVGAAAGGWLPVHLNACALGIGLMAGGVAGMPFNPMGGATAFGVGFGIVLLSC